MKRLSVFILTVFLFQYSFAQRPDKPTSGEIYRSIEKLNFLGTALYFAAHPDDENTRLISHLSNEMLANTAYLSLTRGDGGQNRIGNEIRELLGVIRTHELRGARSIDGGQQFFTRANDFGYSKHPDETLAIWNKDEVLSDAIWVIRKFRPDIIVNRFDHRTPGKTHGHHTSSAMLSVEAFDKAADKRIYPDQLEHVDTWQPRRVFFNTSWWFYGSRDKFNKADKSKLTAVDVGGYLPHSGKSNNEIAAESRSMHKSQGFGSTGTRGSQNEYLETVKGDVPADRANPFDGINTTWSRVKKGKHITELIEKVLVDYDFNAPYKSVKSLQEIKKQIANVKDDHWKSIKLAEIDQIIIDATATFIEFKAEVEYINPGEILSFDMEALNRSNLSISVGNVSSPELGIDTTLNLDLTDNQKNLIEFKSSNTSGLEYSNPYWLNKPGTLGMYNVENQLLKGTPQNKAVVTFEVELTVGGQPLTIQRDLIYKYNDAVKGEVYKPFSVLPKASVSVDQDVYILSDNEPKSVTVKVKSNSSSLIGTIELCSDQNWKTTPENFEVQMNKKGQEAFYTFEITGPSYQDAKLISPLLKLSDDESISKEVIEIDYDHIPYQTVIQNAEAKVVKLDIKTSGNKIAYIEGAGDKVAESLRQIGFDVDEYHPSELTSSTLDDYDACLVGIRAFNVHKEMKVKNDILFEYAKNGGTVIVQYQTNRGLKGSDVSPLDIEMGRDRVTDEFSDISFENKKHPALNFPNKLSQNDFENWVQERGLYYPREWHNDYKVILGMNDKGEDLKTSSILVAEYGEGHYVYTGISFFRQLPAGVPGAYRLLANLISLK